MHTFGSKINTNQLPSFTFVVNSLEVCIKYSFPVAQMVEHGVSNAKIMGSIPRENKS